jgi:hypothetical protein
MMMSPVFFFKLAYIYDIIWIARGALARSTCASHSGFAYTLATATAAPHASCATSRCRCRGAVGPSTHPITFEICADHTPWHFATWVPLSTVTATDSVAKLISVHEAWPLAPPKPRR